MTAALELRGIRKSFGDFLVLNDADFAVEIGSVHALLGENGAGKSSLMNVAAGLYCPDAGSVNIDGVEIRLSGPRDAKAHRIGMVHQNFKLVRRFTVAENVLLANPRPGTRVGLTEIEALIRRHAERLGFEIDPRRQVSTLSVAEQQRVEIIKVLIAGARFLILDEPSAVLTDHEAERLLTTVGEIAQAGAAVVLVTHKLSEVMRFADRVTVMRGGRTLAMLEPKSTSREDLTMLTVGTTVVATRRSSRTARGSPRLDVTGLECARDGRSMLTGTGFFVHSGEIYGIAGVGGNGQGELVEALMGVRFPNAGKVAIRHGEDDRSIDVTHASPARRRDLGFAVIPADREALALAGSLSVAENFAIGQIHDGRYGSWAHVNRAKMRNDTATAVDAFDIHGVRSTLQRASLLSGGNAQKLVLAREFSRKPSIVIAHSPTRGLDVRACAAIHERVLAARAAGAAVLLISEDLDEILALCDRVGVMTRGRIVAEFEAPVDRQMVGRAMVDHA
jgi:general nucleoside transport system ATP-binding protein